MSLRRWLPCLDWGRRYNRASAAQDGLAALIVTLMLIPQSLAYAMLAGLPPEVGLYASVAPLLLYAVFGTSRVLAVGPVAVASLMTASALHGSTKTSGISFARGMAVSRARCKTSAWDSATSLWQQPARMKITSSCAKWPESALASSGPSPVSTAQQMKLSLPSLASRPRCPAHASSST